VDDLQPLVLDELFNTNPTIPANPTELPSASQYPTPSPSYSWFQVGGDIDGVTAGDQSGTCCVALSADGTTVAIGSPNHDHGAPR
jgi:hypothetical protein